MNWSEKVNITIRGELCVNQRLRFTLSGGDIITIKEKYCVNQGLRLPERTGGAREPEV